MAKNEVGYVHFIPPAKDNSRFPACNTHLLIRSLDILIETLKANEDKKFMAWDTETSSLDPTEGFVVGFSFAFNPNTGYYVPVRHVNGSLNREAMEIFYNFMKKFIKMNFLANVRFDMRFFEYSGFDMSEIPYFDVLQAIWLADTNKKMPSLKWAEKHFLGWNPMTFGEALGDNTNFYYVDPGDAYPYACADAEGTFAMAQVAIKFYKEAKLAGKVDNDSLYPIMKFEDTPSMIDTEYLGQCLESETRRLAELDQKIYQMIGYQIKINSSKQLGDALQSMGINTGKFTAKGQMKVDIKTLESVNVNDEYPLISLIIERSRTFKSINSYISTLKEQAEKNGGKLRFSYLTTQVPTGRLACGADKKNNYFAHINVQSIPKPHPMDWYVHEYHDGDPLCEGDVVILGWRFSIVEKSDKIIEGFSQKVNLRSAFIVKEDEYWLSCDYSGEELRIIANYTNEPNWVNTFLSGGDLHKQMAIAMWGEENYDKEKRKKAKVL